jgi:uncharacterized protein (DUF983 family)
MHTSPSVALAGAPMKEAAPPFIMPSAKRMFGRALLLRCPHCGGKGIFATLFTLKEQCPTCGLRMERGESDYFVGAYLFNLCAVEIILYVGVFSAIIMTWPDPPWELIKWVTAALMIAGCFICYPFAKATWLAVDLAIRPLTPEELNWHAEGGAIGDRVLPHI